MRAVRYVLLLTLLAVLCSCTTGTPQNNSNLPPTSGALVMSYPNIPRASPSALKTETPLIEVGQKMQGLSSMVGDMLSIGLYNDRTAEFDDCPVSFSEGTKEQVKTEDVCVRKQLIISESEISTIKELLAGKEFRLLHKNYKKIVSSCDSAPSITLKTKDKTIEVIWCDDIADPQNSPEFPQILSKLFRHFEAIKQGKYSGPALTN
jgi:hypothetical protein